MRTLVTFLFCFWAVTLLGQTDSAITSLRSFSIQPHFGFIIPHRSEMAHLIVGHSRGVNLQWMRRGTGIKTWHHSFNFPEHGLDLYWNYTGNARQLGHQIGLSYLLRLPLGRNAKIQSRQHLGLGIGVGYNTKKWDLNENTQAQVIGSHLNACISLEYFTRLFTTSAFNMSLGFRLTHFSNGAFKLPNLGTNNISIATIIRRNGNKKISIQRKEISDFSKKNNLSLVLGGGLKEITQPLSRKYSSYTLSALYERRFSVKSRFGVGTDLLWSNGVRALRERNLGEEVTWSQNIQLGLTMSYGLCFDNTVLYIQQGFYLWNIWQADGLFYQRVMLRHYLPKNWILQAGLKTHFAKADHFEIGIGRVLR